MTSDNTAPTFELELAKLIMKRIFYVKAEEEKILKEISVAFVEAGYTHKKDIRSEVLAEARNIACRLLRIDMAEKTVIECCPSTVLALPMIKTSDMLRFIAKARVAVKRYWRLRLEEIHKNQGRIVRPKI